MAQIIRYLNENNVKTALGNEFSKNSIRRILTNKKYVGVYPYKGIEMTDRLPKIIDDETFRQAQIAREKILKPKLQFE